VDNARQSRIFERDCMSEGVSYAVWAGFNTSRTVPRSESRGYALRTQTSARKRSITHLLAEKGFEVFLPTYAEVQPLDGTARKRSRLPALYSGVPAFFPLTDLDRKVEAGCQLREYAPSFQAANTPATGARRSRRIESIRPRRDYQPQRPRRTASFSKGGGQRVSASSKRSR
jgi:hypothetical protein